MVQALINTMVAKKKQDRENVKCGLKRTLESLKSGDAGEVTLKGILCELEKVKCEFCGGLGHHAGKCSSIKFVDKTVKELRTTRKIWGTLKAQAKSSGKRTSVVAAVATHLEVEVPAKRARLVDPNPGAQGTGMDET